MVYILQLHSREETNAEEKKRGLRTDVKLIAVPGSESKIQDLEKKFFGSKQS